MLMLLYRSHYYADNADELCEVTVDESDKYGTKNADKDNSDNFLSR
jgi:hypothetical protein